MGVCTKERKGVAAEVLMAPPCTKSLGGEGRGHKHEGVRGTGFAGSASPFLGRERAPVDVDVCRVWLRMPIVKNLEEARRLPARV